MDIIYIKNDYYELSTGNTITGGFHVLNDWDNAERDNIYGSGNWELITKTIPSNMYNPQWNLTDKEWEEGDNRTWQEKRKEAYNAKPQSELNEMFLDAIKSSLGADFDKTELGKFKKEIEEKVPKEQTPKNGNNS